MSDDLKSAADELAAAVEQAAEAQRQVSAVQARIAEMLQSASSAAARVQELAIPPAPPPSSGGKGWGQGPKSGLPWHSGARCQNPAQVQAFIAAGRPGKPVDIIQCFNGRAQAETWDEVAGGNDDSLTDFIGTMSLSEGQRAAHWIWREFPALDAVLTYRPIPGQASNADGKNPKVWEQIAAGEFNRIYRRAGRKLAGLDTQFRRTGRLVIEIAREMTGEWDQHSIVGAHRHFPTAWARIVESMRAGYREATNRDMPHLIWFRPARSPAANGVWTEAIMPPVETWDGIGLSQHDNGWAPCTPQDKRRNWRREGNAEGLNEITELAEKHNKLLGIAEWSSHHDGAKNKSGPHADLFTESMFDWFTAVKDRLAFEAYFLSSETALTPGWDATKAYRRLWGG